MARSLRSLGDRMLTALVPTAEAKGGCPPDCWQQTGCDNVGIKIIRTCCYTGACKVFCGHWASNGCCC